MSAWEYAIMRGERMPSIEELNEMGAIGWELVNYATTAVHMGSTGGHILTFKRPLSTPSNEGGDRG